MRWLVKQVKRRLKLAELLKVFFHLPQIYQYIFVFIFIKYIVGHYMDLFISLNLQKKRKIALGI